MDSHSLLRRLAATLLLVLAAIGVAAAPARVPPKREGVWAQSYVDRAPDPAIRFGRLANGMRYAIMPNRTPPGRMSLRLVIGAGSIDEPDGSEGVAHFLEHMAFRGSTRVADGELFRILQREGLALGADSNASTSPEATIYQFDFPQSAKEDVATGLTMLREIASELTIAPAAVEAERGAVLSEERLRDGPGYRSAKASLGFLLQGQLAADRLPIGTVESIRRADAGLLRRFYEAQYRPDNAVLVVVGDIDAATIEAEIARRFGDWRAKRPRPRGPDYGRPLRRGETARTFAETGAPVSTQVAWVRRYDDRADTAERTKDDLTRFVAMFVLNQRMADISRRADAPFIGAGFGRGNVLHSVDVTTLTVSAPAGRQLEAMRAAVIEQRRALRYGVTRPEFDRALAALEAGGTSAAAGAATRATPTLANRIAADAVAGEVTRNPAQDLADFRDWARGARIEDVEAALRGMFVGAGPLLFVSAAQAPPGGEAAVVAAFDAANRAALDAPAAQVAAGWPYTSFGAAGTVVKREEIADLGVTIVTFANGVRLSVKPTDFAAGEILVNVGFGQGRLGLPPELAHAYWMVTGAPVFTEGGTGRLPAGEIGRVLTGRVVSTALQTGDDAFELAGRTRPADLDVQMQLFAAYISDPGYRPEAETRFQAVIGTALPQIDATPSGVLARELSRLLHSGDARWAALPSAEQLARSRPQDAIRLIAPALDGAIDVTIVGDTSVDKAVAAVAATLGALPARPPRRAPVATGVAFPKPTSAPVILTHGGRADQARAFLAWAAPDFHADPADARALLVTAAVVRQRLFDRIREREGSTYTPEANAVASTTLPGYGFFSAAVEMPPEKLASFEKALDETLADLRATLLTADELERARRPLVEARTRDARLNGYWLGTLPDALRDPRLYEAIRTRVSGVERVTAADVQRVARRYLTPERAYRVQVVPRGVAAQRP